MIACQVGPGEPLKRTSAVKWHARIPSACCRQAGHYRVGVGLNVSHGQTLKGHFAIAPSIALLLTYPVYLPSCLAVMCMTNQSGMGNTGSRNLLPVLPIIMPMPSWGHTAWGADKGKINKRQWSLPLNYSCPGHKLEPGLAVAIQCLK